MPYATSKDCSIYYESHGSGPALVLVHGAGGNHAIWWQQIVHFRRQYNVITVDLRGFGRSGTAAEGTDALDFPEDVLAVLKHAQATQATLLGQSIGAVVALRCAVHNSDLVKAVVLANSVGGLDHPQLTPLVKADRAEAEKLTVIDRLLTKRFQEEQAGKTLLFQQIGTFNQVKLPEIRNVNVPGPKPEEVQAAGLRTFFIAGEIDAVLRPPTVRVAHQLLPGSIIDVVAGGPHSMYWEAPELFNASLERCLQQVYGAT